MWSVMYAPVTIEMSQMGGLRCRKDNNLHAYMVYMPYTFISVTWALQDNMKWIAVYGVM